MLIGIDASRANKKQKTGVEWYSYYLIRELKNIPLKSGDSFILYTPTELKGELGELPASPSGRPLGWHIKILFWPFKYLWTQIRLSWEMIFHPPDVLFVPAHALPVFGRVKIKVGGQASYWRKTKTVITLHDLGFERFPEAYGFWQRLYLRFVYHWASRFAAKIIVPSELTKKELIDLYKTNSQKIEVVPLGYNQEIFRPINDQSAIDRVLNQYKIRKPYILYVGRLEKKKNILNLLKAFRLISGPDSPLPNLTLVLVGQGGRDGPKIKNQISKIKNVVELNYIDHQSLPYLYSAAECFVFPSLYEGFGLPILEAMACGCPVLASRAGSIPEVGGQAIGYFDPRNFEETARAILKMIKDQEFRQEMRQRGLERVKNYSWKKCAEKTYEVLKF